MRKTLSAFAVILVTILYFDLFPSRSAAASGFYVADEISIDGPALFYGVTNDLRQELWSVHCAQPLRACVARSPGLVLRIDAEMLPWLIAPATPGVRISIQNRNYTQDMPNLLTEPLKPDHIKKLSGEGSFVIIEENGRVIQRTRTTGLDRVIDYLTWIHGNTAHTLRDARLWPRNGDIRVQDMTPEVLERYEVMQRRALEAQRQLVPSTKPQIEFAIRAQEGDSFYDPQGLGR